MLDPNITETGVAVAQSEVSGYIYAVQMLGRPRSQQIQFEVTNKAEAEVTYELDGKEFELPPRTSRTHYRCRPAHLMMHLADDKSDSLVPKDGESILVTRQDGGLHLSRQ